MSETATFHVVAATASATSRDADANQDRALAFHIPTGAGAGVVVCDGVGSLPGSAATAETAASAIRRFMQTHEGVVEAMGGCFAAAAHAVADDNDGATTALVVAAEPTGLVGYGIVGNGALVEVLAVEPVPGSWRLHHTELSFPHVGYERGRPALESFLPTADVRVAELGVRRLLPGRHRLFLACTDGLTTEDAPLVLRDERHGGLWRQVPVRLAAVLDAVEKAWPELVAGPAPEHDLPVVLQEAVDALAVAGLLEDDATVGALLLLAEEER